MSNEKLNGLALISIEREIALNLNLDQFVQEFAKNHSNRNIVLS
jgi:hypothetical protein